MNKAPHALRRVFLAISAAWAGPAHAATLNTDMLDACLTVARGEADKAFINALQNHPQVQKMRTAHGTDLQISPDRIIATRERIEAYAASLGEIEANLPTYMHEASLFTGPGAVPDDLVINVVCGGPYDAYGVQANGKLELAIDMSLIAADFFPHLMQHELWHVGFRTRYPEFAKEYSSESGPLRALAFTLLNEGVGHYYSFRRRVEPAMVYTNWPERTAAAFALLHEKTAELVALKDKHAQEELLWSSHVGVPFWKKWGAIPGGIITYRMKLAFGSDAVAKAVAGGPCAFLSGYQHEASRRTDWEQLPDDLVAAACRPAS